VTGVARARDDQQPVALADRGRGGAADGVYVEADVHEAHRGHLRNQPGAALAGAEPAASSVGEQCCRGTHLVARDG
jgi:hypothetical protein